MVEVDAIIGDIVAALDEAGVLDNTFIFVTSDNGPQMDGWPDAGYTPFRGAKGTTWEGGVRVPGIAYWKGMIAPGRVSDGLFDLMDLFNTSLTLAGAGAALPQDRFMDGVDQTSFLLAGRRPVGARERLFLDGIDLRRDADAGIQDAPEGGHARRKVHVDRHVDRAERRHRTLALQPLHRPEGRNDGRPSHERLARHDGGGDEGARHHVPELSAKEGRAGVAKRKP